MPVNFLSAAQRESDGRYPAEPSREKLAALLYLTEEDRALIASLRGDHNRLGFAFPLTTLRSLGIILHDLTDVPDFVLRTLGRQPDITNLDCIHDYVIE